jgi:hypothetical protein
MLLNLAPVEGLFYVGGDLGYTNDPTEIVIFREVSENEKSVLRLVRRIHMEHVAYPHIALAIALIDRYFNAAGIGVDAGGNGLSVVQELTALDKYKEQNLAPRLRGYNFGSSVVIGENDGQEIKKRCKEYMTALINKGFSLPRRSTSRTGLSPTATTPIRPSLKSRGSSPTSARTPA